MVTREQLDELERIAGFVKPATDGRTRFVGRGGHPDGTGMMNIRATLLLELCSLARRALADPPG